VELAERVVAPDAEQPTDLAGVVVVVDVQRDLPRLLAADPTPATLSGKQVVVVGLRQPELPFQVALPRFRLTTLAVLAPVLVQVFLVLLLPALDLGDRVLAIGLVPRSLPDPMTRLALRTTTVPHASSSI
jgi:hypothetical protein